MRTPYRRGLCRACHGDRAVRNQYPSPTRLVWTPTDVLDLRALVAERLPTAEIAARLGRSATAVKTKCSALRLPLTHGRWNPEDDAAIRAHFPTTQTVVLARRLGVTEGAVAKRAQELGVRTETARLPNALALLVARLGLPATLTERQVRMVLSLAGGPMTRVALLAAHGGPQADRVRARRHGRGSALAGHKTYLGSLVALGLVVRVAVPVRHPVGTRYQHL